MAAALILGGILRTRLAITEQGIFWPDEVYQSIEPAHRLVFGYGFIAWEFVEGARSWAFPGLIAGILEVSRALGGDQPGQYLVAVHLVMAALAIASIWAVHELALAIGAGQPAAAAGAFAFALAAPAVYFSFRASGEVASTLPIVLGLALAIRPGTSRRALLLGASLLGVAVLFRLQNALYCLVLIGILGGRRQWRAMGVCTAALAGWALLLGALDWLTWGVWFHSATTYLRFNISPRVADLYGRQPTAYYARNLVGSLGVLAPPLGLLALLSLRRAPGLALGTAVVVGVYTALPHKEYRFIFPVLAIGCALAAAGIEQLRRRPGPRWAGAAIGLVLAGAVGSALAAPGLRMNDLGQYQGGGGYISAYDYGGSANRLLTVAARRPDLCGLRFDVGPILWTGGYSQLHRKIPIYPPTGPGGESGFFNYAIEAAGSKAAATVVATDGDLQLRRLDRQGCVPDPSFSYEVGSDPLRP